MRAVATADRNQMPLKVHARQTGGRRRVKCQSTSSIVDRDMKTERHDLINITVTANFNPNHNPKPKPNPNPNPRSRDN